MSEKVLKSRVIMKNDTEANWLLATGFSPKKGELVVYNPDDNYAYPRIKIGDGETNVNALPFAVTESAVPACSIDDNGKFLRVSNGVATWETANMEGGSGNVDQAEIVNAVIEALPKWTGGSY